MITPFVVEPPQSQAMPEALAPFRAQLADPAVTDLFVNGAQGLFVDRGRGADRVHGWRASEREVRAIASALVAAGGRHVDDAHPCVDVRLDGGIRVHVVLAPVSSSGTAVSIRVPRLGAPGLSDLRERGTLDAATEGFLRDAVARRANFLVTGAAGAGKTTLLAALVGEAPANERIVTVEDVAEIRLRHPHHVALEARQPNLEGAGAIGLDRLVREALRMRPDRLVVGECRGAEVRELLSALNTGHDGGAGTVHANSLADVPARLEALGALAGLGDAALARQVCSAIEFVVHLERGADGTRRVTAIGRFGVEDGRLRADAVEVPHRTHYAGEGSRRRRRTTEREAASGAPASDSRQLADPPAVADDGAERARVDAGSADDARAPLSGSFAHDTGQSPGTAAPQGAVPVPAEPQGAEPVAVAPPTRPRAHSRQAFVPSSPSTVVGVPASASWATAPSAPREAQEAVRDPSAARPDTAPVAAIDEPWAGPGDRRSRAFVPAPFEPRGGGRASAA